MAKRQACLLDFVQATSKDKMSLKIIDENVDLQKPKTQMELSEVNVSFVCGAQCFASGDIAYHKEYLDELDSYGPMPSIHLHSLEYRVPTVISNLCSTLFMRYKSRLRCPC